MTGHEPYTGIESEEAVLLGLSNSLTPAGLEMQAFDALPRRLREYLNYARHPPSAIKAQQLLDQLTDIAPNAPRKVIEKIAVSVLQANDVERSVQARRVLSFDIRLPVK